MKSYLSKMLFGVSAVTLTCQFSACSLLSSRKLANQWEVETEVPAALDTGRASEQPSRPVEVATNPTANGVPSDSNLIDLEAAPGRNNVPAAAPGTYAPGGASLSDWTPTGSDLIDIPKPEIAVAGEAAPVGRPELLTGGATPHTVVPDGQRLDHGLPETPMIVKRKVQPMVDVPASPAATADEIAEAPKALKPEDAPAVPLLVGSGASLSDFYRELHASVLSGASPTVENAAPAPSDTLPPAVAPTPDAAAPVPAPEVPVTPPASPAGEDPVSPAPAPATEE
jgi:hypothetical protein